MTAKRANPHHIKLHRSYTVEEIARTLGVHKNSVRGWQRDGLEPIDTRRPMLFQGRTLRVFLERRNANRKRPCQPGTLYCFKCREPRPPALDMVDWTSLNGMSGDLSALCGTCETIMHRRARKDALTVIMPGIAIQFAQGQPRLKGRAIPSLNCDMGKEA